MFCFNCFKNKINIICSICFEKMSTIIALSCGHLFCDNCINSIINCPLCRLFIIKKCNLLNVNCTKCHKELAQVNYNKLTCFLICGHGYCFNCVVQLKNYQDHYFCLNCKKYFNIYPLYFNKIEKI